MVKRIAEELRHGGGKLLEFFPGSCIPCAEALVDSGGSHRTPLVVVPTEPQIGNVFPAYILGNFFGREVAMVIDDWQSGSVPVVELAGGIGIEQEIVMNKGTGRGHKTVQLVVRM